MAAVLLFVATAYTCRLRRFLVVVLALCALALQTSVLLLQPASSFIANTSILLLALLLGSSIGSFLGNLPTLVSFCIAAAIADIVSTVGGATAALSQSFHAGTSNLLRYLALSFRVRGHLIAVIGVGDLVIITTIFFVLRSVGRTGLLPFAAPTVGLMLALTVGLLVGGVFAIPFIVATTVAYILLGERTSQDMPPTPTSGEDM